MKLLCAGIFLALLACRPASSLPASDPSASTVPPSARLDEGKSEASPTPEVAPTRVSKAFSPRAFETSIGGIPVEGVRFHASTHRLTVADQSAGPGSQWPDAKSAGNGALAAINASFFNPDGSPLGLVITQGQRRGGMNRASSLGAGFFVESASGRLEILRREKFQGGREAIQSGPFLVEDGRTVRGLSETTSSARSFIATDGAGGWVIVRTGPCSLAGLGRALRGAEIDGVKILTALNLDGGRSSEIWASGALAGGPRFTRPLWNKPVRNFLVLQSR